ncbi:MAG TPA: hypothetical protein VF488_10150 [Gemmatimonadaceae bacterium]
MSDETRKAQEHETPEFPQQREDSPYAALNEQHGAPGGARQNVRSETKQGAVARPGGATQNSGGAIVSNDEELGHSPELGHGPGRGAD